MKKKGLAEVISVTLIVLLAIVVGVSVYSYSSNFINSQKKETSNNLYLSASIDDISPEQSMGYIASLPITVSQKIDITITRTDNEDVEISGVRFIFTDNLGNNKIYTSYVPPAETGIPSTYKISSSDINLKDFSSIDKVSILFILSDNRQTPILSEKDF